MVCSEKGSRRGRIKPIAKMKKTLTKALARVEMVSALM